MIDFGEYSTKNLLRQYGEILEELKKRAILRSNNNPTADYAEWLVSRALGLKLQPKSTKGYDAIDSQGKKYEIKGRRITPSKRLFSQLCHPLKAHRLYHTSKSSLSLPSKNTASCDTVRLQFLAG